MLETGIEKTVVITAVVLWFAHGWYLNSRLLGVHKKLDRVLNEFNGLRLYLYEIDPQFDDERQSDEAMAKPDSERDMYAEMDDCFLLRQKEKDGKRTLSTRFSE